MNTTKQVEIVSLKGEHIIVYIGNRDAQLNCDDDDNCGCCIGGFSK